MGIRCQENKTDSFANRNRGNFQLLTVPWTKAGWIPIFRFFVALRQSHDIPRWRCSIFTLRDLMGLQLWDGLVTFGDTRPCCVLAFFQTLPEEEEVLPGSCIPYTHSLIREIGWETSTSYIALYTLHDFIITTMSLESTWINMNLQKLGSEMWWCSLCFSSLNFWGSDFYEAQNGKVEARLKTEGSFHAMTWVLFGLFKIHGLKLQYDPMILDYAENWSVSKWQALL